MRVYSVGLSRALALTSTFFFGWVAATTTAARTSRTIAVLLEEMDDVLAGWNRLETQVNEVLQKLDSDVEALQDEIEYRQKQVRDSQQDIQQQWTAWNKGRVRQLKRDLQAAVDAEIRRRQHAVDQVEEYKRQRQHIQRQKEQKAAGKPIEKLPPQGLTWEQVVEILSPDTLFEERDARVGAWISSLLKQSMEQRPEPVWEWAENLERYSVASAASLEEDSDDQSTKKDMVQQGDVSGCWTLLDAVVHIQQALTNYSHDDGLGITDHAQGARIVHHETSQTFHHVSSHAAGETWGTSKWRDYLVPEDIEEYVLKHFPGWQDWPVWPTKWLPNSLARWTGSFTTAPPETILQPATFPGACWPMQGSSGQVTIVLPYPIHPTAISIDHASLLLVPNRETAPKTMRVKAYAPCEHNDCHGLEYDSEEVYDLFRGHTIEYDSNGNSVQTFWLPPTHGAAKSKHQHDTGDSDSCSAPEDEETEAVASCSGDPTTAFSSETLVRAITLQVLDNWGNADYTCLYRIRVYGDA